MPAIDDIVSRYWRLFGISSIEPCFFPSQQPKKGPKGPYSPDIDTCHCRFKEPLTELQHTQYCREIARTHAEEPNGFVLVEKIMNYALACCCSYHRKAHLLLSMEAKAYHLAKAIRRLEPPNKREGVPAQNMEENIIVEPPTPSRKRGRDSAEEDLARKRVWMDKSEVVTQTTTRGCGSGMDLQTGKGQTAASSFLPAHKQRTARSGVSITLGSSSPPSGESVSVKGRASLSGRGSSTSSTSCPSAPNNIPNLDVNSGSYLNAGRIPISFLLGHSEQQDQQRF